MILHLKKDSVLIDKVDSHRFTWAAGQHSVEDELAKRLLAAYPELFEELPTDEGIYLTPNPVHTTTPTTQEPVNGFICDVCGKQVASQLALMGHRRTHNKPISTSDLLPKR
jgi:hypothetical protein